jgi:hypothetical protein
MFVRSLLDVFVDKELRSRSACARVKNGATITVDGTEKLLLFDYPKADEELERFVVWCVRPATSAESAVRSIKDREYEGKTLGYIFPITSFSPGSEYSATLLQGRFVKIFAGAAALSIIELGIANAHLRLKFEALSEETALRELFDPDLAIVVIGRENMTAAGIIESDVKLLIQESGYFVADLPQEYSWTRPAPTLVGDSCVLGRVSSDVSDATDLIGGMVSLAASQVSAVASLLIYYQVVEILSERLLARRLQKLAAAPPSEAWEVKEALREAVSESSRVKALCHQAQVGVDSDAILRLRDAGLPILASSGVSIKDEPSPAAVLYAVRNLVVHNQKALSAEAHVQLKGFVSALHASVFAMVRRLDLSAV